MNAEAFLEHTAGLVTRRRHEYGEPVDLFEHIATRWSLTLRTKVSPAQVALCRGTRAWSCSGPPTSVTTGPARR